MEETQKSGSDPFVGISEAADEKQSPLTTRGPLGRTIPRARGGAAGRGGWGGEGRGN